MKSRSRKSQIEARKIAKDRIRSLLENADDVFKEDNKLADRYIHLARKMAMKHNVRMPADLKRKFCSHCYSYLRPGINCRIRSNDGMMVYYCLNCKKFMRFPYLKEKSKQNN